MGIVDQFEKGAVAQSKTIATKHTPLREELIDDFSTVYSAWRDLTSKQFLDDEFSMLSALTSKYIFTNDEIQHIINTLEIEDTFDAAYMPSVLIQNAYKAGKNNFDLTFPEQYAYLHLSSLSGTKKNPLTITLQGAIKGVNDSKFIDAKACAEYREFGHAYTNLSNSKVAVHQFLDRGATGYKSTFTFYDQAQLCGSGSRECKFIFHENQSAKHPLRMPGSSCRIYAHSQEELNKIAALAHPQSTFYLFSKSGKSARKVKAYPEVGTV